MQSLFVQSFKDNRYFFIPLLCWVMLGAILQLIFTPTELFMPANQFFNPLLDYLNTSFSFFGRGDTITVILVSFMLIPGLRNRRYISASLIFGIMIPTTIYFSKLFFHTPRPLTVYGPDKVHTVHWLDNLFMNSFPSGHTIGAFGFFMLLSLFLPLSYKRWSIAFFMLALACGYSRLYLGQHFFGDVYAGSIIGSFLTWVIYVIIHSYDKKPTDA
jgi:membrane-associated phospholipid phosphatase